MTTGRPPFDAVVLAGGAAARLGGTPKPDVRLGDARLLDHVLAAAAGARRQVVVAPESVAVPPGVLRTLEDPPLGGPVAGLAAGLTALAAAPPDAAVPDLVVVLSCDVPLAGTAVPRLLAGVGPDGACLTDATGHPQWLVAVYRRAALERVLAGTEPRGTSLRRLLAGLDLARVPSRGEEAADVDTWADLAALDRGARD